jgi:hypothetical protein
MMEIGAVPVTDCVLRTSDGAVIERPRDLILGPPPPTSTWSIAQWAISWYEDPLEPAGFVSVVWPQSKPRGLMIPKHSATGDIIEFGLAYQDVDGQLLPASITRWYGWLNYGTSRSLVVKGRYPTLSAAARDAATIIDLVCLNEIDPERSFDISDLGIAELDDDL